MDDYQLTNVTVSRIINVTISIEQPECSCPDLVDDLVLPPYIVVVFSVMILTALSLVVNICELKVRFGYDIFILI